MMTTLMLARVGLLPLGRPWRKRSKCLRPKIR